MQPTSVHVNITDYPPPLFVTEWVTFGRNGEQTARKKTHGTLNRDAPLLACPLLSVHNDNDTSAIKSIYVLDTQTSRKHTFYCNVFIEN